MEQPIFIFGQARSGSTLVQRLFNSYPNVIIYGEHLGLLRDIASSYHSFLRSSGKLKLFQEPDMARVAQLTLARLKEPRDFSPMVNGLQITQFQNCYREFVRSLFHNIPVSPGVRWGFKEVCYLGGENSVFDMMGQLFPDCRMIFLVRNPLDQIASKEGTGWWKDSIEAKTQTWIAQAHSYVSYTAAHPNRAILVRYEDLIRPETNEAKRMVEFVGYDLGAKQQLILFKLAKIGAVNKKPDFPPELRQKIISDCVNAGPPNLYAEF